MEFNKLKLDRVRTVTYLCFECGTLIWIERTFHKGLTKNKTRVDLPYCGSVERVQYASRGYQYKYAHTRGFGTYIFFNTVRFVHLRTMNIFYNLHNLHVRLYA